MTKKKKNPKMTSREKILKYCKIERERGKGGEILLFGTHTYRLNRLLNELTETECDQTVKNMVKIFEFDIHMRSVDKKATTVNKRRIVVTVDPKPCECGCGEMTRRGSKFRPGHDMRLKSALRKAAKSGNANAKAKAQKELKSRGWE